MTEFEKGLFLGLIAAGMADIMLGKVGMGPILADILLGSISWTWSKVNG